MKRNALLLLKINKNEERILERQIYQNDQKTLSRTA